MAIKTPPNTEFEKLLLEGDYLKKIPKTGDAIKGKIISANRREVRIDIEGVTTGVIRGRELFAESSEYTGLKSGEEVEATVIDIENENGEMELSFRFAGQAKAWDDLRRLYVTGEIVPARVIEANKGGLIIKLKHITGFMPVSQLSPDNYPRVSGGDKQKILEKLKKFVGTDMDVKVFDVNEQDEKLIVSEKVVWEERQKGVIQQYNVGDQVEGEITAIADFGVFVKFDSLEGLVHISEIAWQRIDHPSDLVKVGDKVKAEVIGIEGSKIFLSMKKLIDDPWKHVHERYNVGDVVDGTVLKINPFGFFVELDPEIHGLAHVSEIAGAGTDINSIAKSGDVLKFKIVSIEPEEHRLGLTLDLKKKKEAEPKTEEPKDTEDTGVEAQHIEPDQKEVSAE